MQAKIISTGRFVPPYVLTNPMLEQMVDTSDEWITTRTGIKERHISTDMETWELAAKAAENAIDKAGISPLDIDAIFISTVTPDCFTPSTACLVQDAIGAKNAICMDINAACTGFIYALDTADSYIKAGKVKTALVIGAEILSKITDYTDRNTCVLFGDGAGAAVLTAADHGGILSSFLYADGSGHAVLNARAMGLNSTFCENPKQSTPLYMNGKETYKFAVGAMAEAIEKVCASAGILISEAKYFVPHQANQRIIATVAKHLHIPIERFCVNIDRYGNTSSASVAIALDELNRGVGLEPGDKIVLVGFGGGLTYGAVLVEW